MIMMRESYVKNYNFAVKLGLFNLSFSKITSISSAAEYETIGNGGINDTMYFFQKPKRNPDTILFERGIKLDMADDFYSLVTEGTLIRNITIIVKQGISNQRIFWIDQGIVTRRSFGDLNASDGALLIRSIEMAHTGLVELAV